MTRGEWRRVWEERIALWRASGLSMRRFAEREGLAYRTMKRWLCRLSGKDAKSDVPGRAGAITTWVPIEVQAAVERPAAIEIRVRGGRVIAVSGEFDDERLARLISVVERAA